MGSEPEISVFRPDRPGIRKVLGNLEAEIMEVVWSRPHDAGSTVRDVFEVLYERRRLAYTTVMSTMARLAKKNLLRAEKREQAYVYSPRYTEQEFVSRFVARLLEDLLVGFTGRATAGLDLPDARTVMRARKLLDEIEKRRASGEDG